MVFASPAITFLPMLLGWNTFLLPSAQRTVGKLADEIAYMEQPCSLYANARPLQATLSDTCLIAGWLGG